MPVPNRLFRQEKYEIGKGGETIKTNLTEEQRKAIRPEIDKLISIFERPENQSLKFDLRQLKKWIIEYNPKITQNYLEYISCRVMVNVKTYRLKREDPEKYAEYLKQKIEYNKTHPEVIRRGARKRYLKIKANPILWEKMRASQKKYIAMRYKEDPEYRKKQTEYQKRYYKKMKEEDPEKYHAMQRTHRRMCKYITGVRCPNCGNPIKTTTIGFLGKRPVQCPKCRFSCPKNQCEKIKIPRIFPETQKRVEDTKKPPDEMIISEQALEGLRNLGMVFQDEMGEPKEIMETQKKAMENIKRKMAKFVDSEEMIQ